jgi:hypothetical protein
MSEGLDIRTHRVDLPAVSAGARARERRKLAWMAGGSALLGLMMSAFSFGGASPSERLAMGAFLAAMLFLGAWRGTRVARARMRDFWASYELTMGPNTLRRTVVNLPPLEIVRPDVTGLERSPRGVTVKTRDRHAPLFIPVELIGYDDVVERLATWRSIEPARTTRALAPVIGWTVLYTAAFLAATRLPDLRPALAAGLVLVVMSAIALRNTLRTPLLDSRTRSATIGGLVMMMLAPLARLILHLLVKGS